MLSICVARYKVVAVAVSIGAVDAALQMPS